MLALSLPKGPSLLSDAQLAIPKTLATNSRVSITSKLIEIKGLQVLYSGHLRKTGGRGSYRLVHVTHLVVQKKAAQLSLGIPAPTRPPGGGGVPVSWSDRACKSFLYVSYAKPGGGGLVVTYLFL